MDRKEKCFFFYQNLGLQFWKCGRYEKAIDPDEEFLQDIEQRKSLEHAYLAAETKVYFNFTPFDYLLA